MQSNNYFLLTCPSTALPLRAFGHSAQGSGLKVTPSSRKSIGTRERSRVLTAKSKDG